MSVEERQSMIIDAVIPLLIEHGRSVTSKQIAEAACVAEGTIFRAFGDKDTLVTAAIEKYLDPEPLRQALRSIDPALPLENKVRAIIYLMRERFSSMFRMIAAIGGERPPVPHARHEFPAIIAEVLAPEAAMLNWPPERVAHIVRMISVASSFPALNEGMEFSVDELARVVLYGIAGKPVDPHETLPPALSTTATATSEDRTCS
ncbi:TetR/AcrR family transcriptional regulator [Diaminobutyricibacter tongyongensis]|uniref:TetR/AcrR family transcriptional regulator n=1 Tax=Leifsonia tongyongensis TaxID=1268043 RepID=A0A6L9Y159_9MICO|nr:TetR/AcrR family transcriptional regulator [Diaminobutyricibacter tongyongensis]